VRYRVRLSARRLPIALGWIVGGLVLAHLGYALYALDGRVVLWSGFSLREKLTVPNWYSAFALLLAGGLLVVITARKRAERDRDTLFWFGLATGFAAMSVDRIACIHQLLNTYSRVSWEIPGAVLVAIIGVSYIGFLRRLPARTRNRFLIAGTVYVFGVIVLEAIENPYLLGIPVETVADSFIAIPDEGTQMLGVVLFIAALLDYLRGARKGS
jgi:hypothetical protein